MSEISSPPTCVMKNKRGIHLFVTFSKNAKKTRKYDSPDSLHELLS